MSSFRPFRTAALAAALALASAPALATEFSNTVFFGDSLSDSGHFRPVIITLVGPDGAVLGRFTTNPGLVWTEWLADYYGGNAASDNQGGTDYAVGGARVDVDTVGTLGPTASLTSQVEVYLAATGGQADPNALYTVWGGANDLFSITDPATAPATIGGAVTAEIGIVGALQAAGARYIMVANIPDLGMTPAFSGDPLMSAQGTQLSNAYNSALFGGLASQGLRVIPVDAYSLLHEIVADPGLYGFTNVTGTACSPLGPGGGSALFCSPGSYVAPGAADSYLFADGVHPSSRAHQILAQYAVSLLEAPNQIAVLPHSEAVIGRARAERVAGHLAGRPAGDGMRWWSDVRADFQRYGDGEVYDGQGASLGFGLDWTSGNLVYGGFAGWGRQNLDWGMRRGDFSQEDATLGGFVGWYGDDGAWVNGQLSYSRLDFDLDRDVVLGPATRTHHGSTDGSNLSAGVSGGWTFTSGNWQHGPVASVLWQKIDIDGFAESDPALSTSLAYPDQDFRSLIGSLGWQFAWTGGHVQPYARLTWDREFKDMPDEAFAQAQSIPSSLPYAVPGIQFDRNYGTALLGARTSVLGLDANVGVSLTVGQAGGNDASAFLSLGKGF